VLNKFRGDVITGAGPADAAKPHRVATLAVCHVAEHGLPEKMASSTSAPRVRTVGRHRMPIPTSAISMSCASGQSCRPVRQLGASGANHRVGGSAHPAGLKNVPSIWPGCGSADWMLPSRRTWRRQPTLAICGGLQMLGGRPQRPFGVEGEAQGLGLLPSHRISTAEALPARQPYSGTADGFWAP